MRCVYNNFMEFISFGTCIRRPNFIKLPALYVVDVLDSVMLECVLRVLVILRTFCSAPLSSDCDCAKLLQ